MFKFYGTEAQTASKIHIAGIPPRSRKIVRAYLKVKILGSL